MYFFGEMKLRSCHNPIFTLGIFSGVGMQNETTRTKPGWPNKGSPYSKEPQDGAWSTFPGVWRSLTKFKQLWPRRWLDQKLDLADHPLTIG